MCTCGIQEKEMPTRFEFKLEVFVFYDRKIKADALDLSFYFEDFRLKMTQRVKRFILHGASIYRVRTYPSRFGLPQH